MKNLFDLFPKPSPLRAMSRVYDLKTRLDWGEPALTIIDIRRRALFNERHIVGAISMPATVLVERAQTSLEPDRDLYVYGDTDDEAIAAAETLKAAGYEHVSVLRGGVAAWKAAGFPVEMTPAAA